MTNSRKYYSEQIFSLKKKFLHFSHAKIKKIFKVNAIIKLNNSEFKIAEKSYNQLYNHFNISHTHHKKNKFYLLVKIKKKGTSGKNNFKYPILDGEKGLIAQCEKIQNKKNYSRVDALYLKNSVLKNRKINSLKKFILEKYNSTLKELDRKKKLDLGVAITTLSIKRKIQLKKYLKGKKSKKRSLLFKN